MTKKNSLNVFFIFFFSFVSFYSMFLFIKRDTVYATRESEVKTLEDKFGVKKSQYKDPLFSDSYLRRLLLSKGKPKSKRDESDSLYVEGELLIKYRKDIFNLFNESSLNSEESFLESKGLKPVEKIKGYNISVARIDDEKSIKEKLEELSSDPSVEYAQPNYIYKNLSIDTNDPYKSYLWGLDNYGQTVEGQSGLADKDIDAPEAWEILKRNNNEVIVAVIDDGVNYYTDDLVDSMWDGSNCVDELGHAILGGCLHGYDYDDNDNDPLPDWGGSHGTHIAGTIAATGNNGFGIIGVSPNIKIMVVKISFINTVSAINSLSFAKQNGAKVVNGSWGGVRYDQALREAISDFPGLFIAAAGNGTHYGDDNGVFLMPNLFHLETIMAMGLGNLA